MQQRRTLCSASHLALDANFSQQQAGYASLPPLMASHPNTILTDEPSNPPPAPRGGPRFSASRTRTSPARVTSDLHDEPPFTNVFRRPFILASSVASLRQLPRAVAVPVRVQPAYPVYQLGLELLKPPRNLLAEPPYELLVGVRVRQAYLRLRLRTSPAPAVTNVQNGVRSLKNSLVTSAWCVSVSTIANLVAKPSALAYAMAIAVGLRQQPPQ